MSVDSSQEIRIVQDNPVRTTLTGFLFVSLISLLLSGHSCLCAPLWNGFLMLCLSLAFGVWCFLGS